ncbi:MAG: hypothetical protein M3P26_16325 [Gemmatimonadota bacterium]|nr:hypothetical protein [Gemmatimonadota bacterium]
MKAPEPLNLFDITNQAPPTPMRVNSATSIDAAKETSKKSMTRRRLMVLLLLKSTSPGLARFQIAQRLAIPDHWVSSTVAVLITMRKIEEHPSRTVINPASGKTCAVLVALESGEGVAA